ncbi:MAG TPA: BamA/TamA family outer membrane protein [Polyangiaceae bacterium]
MWPARLALGTAFAVIAAVLSAARGASAEPPSLSALEARTLREQAERLGAKETPLDDADGKLIEGVDIVVLDVFDEHDPVPDFVNVFHTMSRKWVIGQELLFAPGERYSARRAQESARNLRKIRQLSVVLVVPLEGSAPDRVRVLVITRDVWSLRLNWDLEATAGKNGPTITRLVVNPSEENFLGTHTTVGALFTLDPGTYSIGLNAARRRMFGTDLEMNVLGSVIYGRVSGEPEGSYGAFTYGAPIRTTTDRWGWGTGIAFRDDIARRYDAEGRVERFDAEATAADDALPIEYERERFVGGVEVVRSFGRTQKYDLAVGAEADRTLARYRHGAGADPAALQEFDDEWLPVNDTRLSPFVQLRTHGERYFHTIDLETLALQEDYRLGPEVLLRAYPASRAAGSTRDLLGLKSGLSYTTSFGDGMARAVAVNTVEYELHGNHDASIEARVHVATPRFSFGRVVVDGLFADRYENYLNLNYSLGGSERLRGYPLSGFQGSSRGSKVVAANAELRTTSMDIWSMQVGLAAFYDGGGAADEFDELRFLQSTGLGLRILFPQLDRTVFRIDWGFPLSPGYSTLPGALFVSFGQAFAMPELQTPTVMDPDLN